MAITLASLQITPSGNKQLDALLEEYFLLNPLYEDYGDSTHLQDMRGSGGAGWCGSVAEHFTKWLKKKKVKATEVDTDRATEEWYPDRPLEECGDSHCATKVVISGKTLLVDWTAGQFGYKELGAISTIRSRLVSAILQAFSPFAVAV